MIMNIVKLNTQLNKILKELIDSGKSISIKTSKEVQKDLTILLRNLQFEELQAEKQEKWELLPSLRLAVDESTLALDEVNAAIIRAVVVNQHEQDMKEMADIRDRINSAAKAQQTFDGIVGLASILIRVFALPNKFAV
jgi:hypothetical protein